MSLLPRVLRPCTFSAGVAGLRPARLRDFRAPAWRASVCVFLWSGIAFHSPVFGADKAGVVASNEGVSLTADAADGVPSVEPLPKEKQPAQRDGTVDEPRSEQTPLMVRVADHDTKESSVAASSGAVGLEPSSAGLVGPYLPPRGEKADQPRVSRSGGRLKGGAGTESRSPAWYSQGWAPMLLVLGAVGATFAAARRWLPLRRIVASRAVSVAARTSIAPRQSLLLVSVGRRFVLVGASRDRFDALCEISDPEEVADLAARTGTSAAHRAGAFDATLQREQRAHHAADLAADEDSSRVRPASGGDYLARLLSRLRQLQGAPSRR